MDNRNMVFSESGTSLGRADTMPTVLSGSGSFYQDAATQILYGNYASESTKEQTGGWLLQKLSLWQNGMGF